MRWSAARSDFAGSAPSGKRADSIMSGREKVGGKCDFLRARVPHSAKSQSTRMTLAGAFVHVIKGAGELRRDSPALLVFLRRSALDFGDGRREATRRPSSYPLGEDCLRHQLFDIGGESHTSAGRMPALPPPLLASA